LRRLDSIDEFWAESKMCDDWKKNQGNGLINSRSVSTDDKSLNEA